MFKKRDEKRVKVASTQGWEGFSRDLESWWRSWGSFPNQGKKSRAPVRFTARARN